MKCTFSFGFILSTFFVLLLPTRSFGAITGATYVCSGASILLSDSVGGGTWSSSNTARGTVDNLGIVTGISTGNVTITHTYAGGTAFAIKFIKVNPTLSIGATATSVCVGLTVTYTCIYPGGVWTSSNPAIATVNAATGVITGIAPGVATITYTLCGRTATRNITVNALPDVPAIGGPDNVCVGDTIQLTNAAAGGTQLWTSSNTGKAVVYGTAGKVIGKAAGEVVISFRYVITNCTTYVTKDITVKALTTPTITGTATVCINSTTMLTGAPAGGMWSSGTPAKATVDADGEVTGIASGGVNISYAYTNMNGCTAKVVRVVTVKGLPGVGAITGPNTVCAGATITLGNVITSGVWSSSNPAAGTIGSASGILTGIAGGVTTIRYTVTGINGCVNFKEKDVTVNAPPAVPEIMGDDELCVGTTKAYTNAAGGTYMWIAAPTTVATVNAVAGVVRGITAGAATLSYKFTDMTTGCINYATKAITVRPAVVPAISGGAAVCIAGTTMLTATPDGGAWTSSATAKATIGVSSGVMTGIASGTTMITYIYTNEFGCDGAASVTGTVNAQPAVGAITGTASTCVGAPTIFASATSGGEWISASPGIATVSGSGVVTGVSAGTGVITYLVTGENGCTGQKTKTVTVIPPPDVPAITAASWSVCQGTNAAFSESTTGGSHIWLIDPTGVATVNASSGVVTGVTPGTATLSYQYTLSGCTNYATGIVTVDPPVTVDAIEGPDHVEVYQSISLSCATPGGIWISDEAKATIDGSGTVTGVSTGAVTITYQVPGCGPAYSLHSLTVDPVNNGGGAGKPGNIAAPAINGMIIYPNPTTGIFKIESPVAGTFTIYTLEGKELQGMHVEAGINTLSMPVSVAAGVYMCRFAGEQGATTMVRLIYKP